MRSRLAMTRSSSSSTWKARLRPPASSSAAYGPQETPPARVVNTPRAPEPRSAVRSSSMPERSAQEVRDVEILLAPAARGLLVADAGHLQRPGPTLAAGVGGHGLGRRLGGRLGGGLRSGDSRRRGAGRTELG